MASEQVSSFPARRPTGWFRSVVMAGLVCLGSIAILLPAWLPNASEAPVERGMIELLQALLLAGATALMLAAAPHAGSNRPICLIMAAGLGAAVVGELEDLISGVLNRPFPEAWVIAFLILLGLRVALKNRKSVLIFIGSIGNHAGSGLIAAALLILYVFNHVIGSHAFWRAAAGEDVSSEIPNVSKSYLELLACYLIFIGTLGYAITFARRPEPPESPAR